MNLVVDASFAAALLMPDETRDDVRQFADSLDRAKAVVPALWPLEVLNVFIVAERRKRIDAPQFAQLLNALDLLAVTVDVAPTASHRADIARLARKHNLTAYDAAYLELAIRERSHLLTLDASLARAAEAERIVTPLS